MNTRLPSLDVTRAVAMFGVVALNFHGYLNAAQWTNPVDPSPWEKAFNPLTGILTTRFAATFVFVAGIGITLFLRAAGDDGAALTLRRIVLFRRGLFLFGLGSLLQWIWPGTIIFYYGAYFMIAALVATWSTRTLVALAGGVTLAACAIAGFRFERGRLGESTAWLSPQIDSPRNLMIRVFIDYTHPVLPWLTFLLAGVILGRHLHRLDRLRRPLIITSLVTLVFSHVMRTIAWPHFLLDRNDVVRRVLVSTDPYDRSLLYTVSALSTATLAFLIVSVVTDSRPPGRVSESVAVVGRLSLSIYVLHVFFYNALVKWWGLFGDGGLATAIGLALVFYVLIFVVSRWWSHYLGTGPMERVYRLVGG